MPLGICILFTKTNTWFVSAQSVESDRGAVREAGSVSHTGKKSSCNEHSVCIFTDTFAFFSLPISSFCFYSCSSCVIVMVVAVCAALRIHVHASQ